MSVSNVIHVENCRDCTKWEWVGSHEMCGYNERVLNLPVIVSDISCHACSVCCLEQGSPHLFLGLLRGFHLPDDPDPDPEDFHRMEDLPAAARKELEEYAKFLAEGGETDGSPRKINVTHKHKWGNELASVVSVL